MTRARVVTKRVVHGEDQARQIRGEANRDQREDFLRQAVRAFEQTLLIDSENAPAHYNLNLLFGLLGDEQQAAEHRKLHQRYKPDDNAADRAVRLAREKYPAANQAAEALVIYSLHRQDEPAAAAGE